MSVADEWRKPNSIYTRRLCIEIGEFSSLRIRYRPRSHIDKIRHERRDRAFQQSRIA
jgi:hypothetical protein